MSHFVPINPKEDVMLLGEVVQLPSSAPRGSYMETALMYWNDRRRMSHGEVRRGPYRKNCSDMQQVTTLSSET